MRIEAALAQVSPVFGDAGLLQQAVTNLVLNALQATPAGGWVRLEVSEAQKEICLCVEDSGPEIPPQVRARLFEPFVTTKEQGSGLGLPQVRTVVEQHGDSISVETGRVGGACFRIKLPAQSAA